jgi:hypothetical protein
MLKHLVPIVAATLLLLIVWASAVPLFHWFGVEEPTQSFEEHRAKWQSLGMDSYEFVIEKKCFCGPPGNIPIKVVVRDSLNIAAYDSREPFDQTADKIDAVPDSVPALFILLATAASGDSTFSASFDDDFGFPNLITIDAASDTGSGETVWTVKQFREMPDLTQ